MQHRPHGWMPRVILNGTGAVLSALAAVVFFASKFLQGAWLLVFIIPALMLLFGRIERYYRIAGAQLGIGEVPPAPELRALGDGLLVLVPVVSAPRLTKLALETALKIGDLHVLPSERRNLVTPVVDYVRQQMSDGREVTVLLAEVQPRHRRHQILPNQRGLLLAAALRSRTDAVVATVSFRLH